MRPVKPNIDGGFWRLRADSDRGIDQPRRRQWGRKAPTRFVSSRICGINPSLSGQQEQAREWTRNYSD
jgi:hypothetical protein